MNHQQNQSQQQALFELYMLRLQREAEDHEVRMKEMEKKINDLHMRQIERIRSEYIALLKPSSSAN